MKSISEPITKEGNEHHLQSIIRWFRLLDDNEESIESLDRDMVKDYHTFAINQLLAYVFKENPFYRQRLINAGYSPDQPIDLDTYRTIPLMRKKDIRDNYQQILTKKKLAHICKSTGTTGGSPTYIGHTIDELYNYYLAPKYPKLMGRVKDRVVANALPYEMSSSALTFHHEFQHLLGCTILPIGKGGTYSDPEIAIQFMKDWNAEVLVTTPSYAIELYEAAQAMNINVQQDFQIQQIFLTGEGTSHNFRKRIENLWNSPSVILYGSLESMLIGIECEYQDGFHLADGHLFIEIVDQETGLPLEPGQQGEIVVTTLLREGMPLIRYRTGDLGFIDEQQCGCGIEIPRLFLRGRTSDQIKLISGEYSPFYIEDIIMQVDNIGNWYRLIVKDDQLTVEAEPKDNGVDRELLSENIRSLIEFHLNVPCDVQIVDKVRRNKGKTKRVWLEA
ncbi:phenylacetate--CoA ligase family protein [Niallia sp. 03133]|uniref:phenylacetate--CoA ligase family protein n=1 Tax=Niallia sp. 03133 TaxID=3458060 RepID=UPI0040439BC1